MAFPTTSALSNFTLMADAGPPPSADYVNGPYNSEGMVIENGACVADPFNVSEMGNALWISSTYGPDFEIWVTIGTVDDDWGYASLFLYDVTQTTGYILTWLTADNSTVNSITLYDENLNTIWSSNYVPILTDGCSFGMETFQGDTLTIYTDTGSGWDQFITITGLTIPTVGYIGFGAFAP